MGRLVEQTVVPPYNEAAITRNEKGILLLDIVLDEEEWGYFFFFKKQYLKKKETIE